MKTPVFLRIYRDGQLELVKQFTDEQIVLGKNPESQVSLNDSSVSPVHAVIEMRDTGYYVSDLGSNLGTMKNGKKIFDEALQSGDELQIGPFRIEFFIGVPKPNQPPKATTVAKSDDDMPSTPPPITVKKTPPPVEKPVSYKPAPSQVVHAPPVGDGDLTKTLRNSKGTIVEVVVAWKDRVISTHHFEDAGPVKIGSDEGNTIVVPLVGMTKPTHTLMLLGPGVKIYMTPEMTGSMYKDNAELSFAELKRKGRIAQTAAGFEMDLTQGEMVRVGLHGDLVNIYIRFISETPKPLVGPVLDLTAAESTSIIMSLVVSILFGLFMAIYSPVDLEEEDKLEQQIRKAVVTFKPPPKVQKEVVKVEEVPQQKKVVKVDMDAKQTTTKKDPGAAGELKPSAQNKKTNIVSSTVKQGGAINTGKSGANVQAEKKDVSKTGLLSVFGSKGTQKELDKSYSGAGELVGMAGQATGSAGFDEDRAGDNLGGRLKNVGAGGKGTQTYGISGPGTSGKGTGTYGGGTGGIGQKGRVDLNVGDSEAEFSGTIDKDAIRRVIRDNKRLFENCYNQALRRDSGLYGKIEIQWNIIERGQARLSKVKSNSTGDKQMGECVARVISGLTFPEPPPDQEAQITYPFVFSSQ